MKANVALARFSSHATPGVTDRHRVQAALGLRRGEYPDGLAGQAIEDRARGRREPDRARPGLAIGQERLALAVEGSFQGDDLALVASGKQQQAYDRHDLRPVGLVACQHLAQSTNLRSRQEALPPLAAIPLDALARIGSLRPVTVDLGLAHDDRQDRRGSVRRYRGLVKGRESALNVV